MTQQLTTAALNYQHLSRSLKPAILMHLTPDGRARNIQEAHELLQSDFPPSNLNNIIKLLEELLKEPLEECDRVAIQAAIDVWNVPQNNPQ